MNKLALLLIALTFVNFYENKIFPLKSTCRICASDANEKKLFLFLELRALADNFNPLTLLPYLFDNNAVSHDCQCKCFSSAIRSVFIETLPIAPFANVAKVKIIRYTLNSAIIVLWKSPVTAMDEMSIVLTHEPMSRDFSLRKQKIG